MERIQLTVRNRVRLTAFYSRGHNWRQVWEKSTSGPRESKFFQKILSLQQQLVWMSLEMAGDVCMNEAIVGITELMDVI
jgi:hypothetical protein